jgi:hypothetical protein
MIPRGLPREFQLLEQTCRERLRVVLNELSALASEQNMLRTEFQAVRLRRYRRVIEEMDLVEMICLPALARAQASDKHLNRVVEHIRAEIRYPLLPPVISPLSQSYFHSFPNFNLLLVPLSEGNFLLHLPDLYHELGHFLFVNDYDDCARIFQARMGEVLDTVRSYFVDEEEKETLRRGPERFRFDLHKWATFWHLNWGIEFFCDLFATFTLGPAFLWSHLHLCATRGEDPFHVPTFGTATHPAEAARMVVMLEALRVVGFNDAATDIEWRWNELIEASNTHAEPEYYRCYPPQIITEMVERAFAGVREMGCRIAEPSTGGIVHNTLNNAWHQFWRAPEEFAEWEQAAIVELGRQCDVAPIPPAPSCVADSISISHQNAPVLSCATANNFSKVKILFLSANPSSTSRLGLDEEIRAITQKIRASAHRDLVEIVAYWAVQPDDLLQALNEHEPHIIHFSGHGSNAQEIILNDGRGLPQPVSKKALVNLFKTFKGNIRMVLLNACFSQPQAEGIVEHVPCAIGMSNSIGDRAAISFAASFYRAIGFGRTVKEAFDQGVAALMLEGIDEESIPTLLTRPDSDAAKIRLVSTTDNQRLHGKSFLRS